MLSGWDGLTQDLANFLQHKGQCPSSEGIDRLHTNMANEASGKFEVVPSENGFLRTFGIVTKPFLGLLAQDVSIGLDVTVPNVQGISVH